MWGTVKEWITLTYNKNSNGPSKDYSGKCNHIQVPPACHSRLGDPGSSSAPHLFFYVNCADCVCVWVGLGSLYIKSWVHVSLSKGLTSLIDVRLQR